ncbi:hypothetical protein KIN20_002192 [Parelaphostrongylus tenuis]|uniref:Uncharacterized protein n=1 Tax=Parelaphostrongylus tenuis TaxID=148309 RepID=A0AAD5MDS9_PARTN|nr:hypothetical protein KIN20_002126 [Parelaphostrongylus tenuis]KAJ1347191.1 hypothetical protein KIN20_002192 [Parelaphostrongylus tenuis]
MVITAGSLWPEKDISNFFIRNIYDDTTVPYFDDTSEDDVSSDDTIQCHNRTREDDEYSDVTIPYCEMMDNEANVDGVRIARR